MLRKKLKLSKIFRKRLKIRTFKLIKSDNLGKYTLKMKTISLSKKDKHLINS